MLSIMELYPLPSKGGLRAAFPVAKGLAFMAQLETTPIWDKVFPQSDKVDHEKVTFRNRYGIELAADLYKPKGAEGPLAAIAFVGGGGWAVTARFCTLRSGRPWLPRCTT